MEYLARVVFNTNKLLYPDSVVGTDSHTTMIDGLGVAGWGVGGIEAEAAMLGQVRHRSARLTRKPEPQTPHPDFLGVCCRLGMCSR